MWLTALYYMKRLQAPIDMCDEMATSLCRFPTDPNSMLAIPVRMVKRHLYLRGIDVDDAGIHDFVGIMKHFHMEQWPVMPTTSNLTNLLAEVTTQLGYYPLVTISLAKVYESRGPVVSLDKPTLLLRKVGFQTDMTMAAMLLFTLAKYLQNFCDRYAVCLQRGQTEHIVATIIKFEQLLSFYMRAPGKQKRIKVKDMGTKNVSTCFVYTGQRFLLPVLGRHHNITPETDVVIKSPLYLNGLDEVLEQSDESVVTLYIGYTIFSWFAPLIVNLDASTNVRTSRHSRHNRLWSKFQCLLLSESVFGFAYLHAFASKPGFDVKQSAIVNATKLIIRALRKFTIITPWFKKQDADLINRKQPQTNKYLPFCFTVNADIPAIHSTLVNPSTRTVRFLEMPVLAYYVLHALLPMFFHAGSVYDENGAYDEWWRFENEEGFARAERCLVRQFLESTKSYASKEEAKSLGARVMNQNFILAPSFEAFKNSLEESRYSMSNFSLHHNFPADSKQVFYAAHMMALCDETDTAQNSFIYRMFNEEFSDFYRQNVPFYNFPEYEDQISDCEAAPANELSKLRRCRIWNEY
ncbi:hypothetical protein MRX96_034789 [Rhipicephalus microplus]